MISRFQIEDLISQDSSGVVFRALDTDTGKPVALRRFFPFGADGGGLQAEEQTAYTIAVNRLADISHPALRSIICGGCDPVDGMPFIATEWIEGSSLQPFIQEKPLAPEVAAELIGRALEVCELLSHVLAEEAVWLETDLRTVIVGSPESRREVTFWISPLKWLSATEQNRGLESIITLTEDLMGWKGQIVSDQAGCGLGGWLKWLRAAAATTTLLEAREMLAASIGEEPPAPAKTLIIKATTRPLKRPLKPALKPSRSKAPCIFFLCLALVITGIGSWLIIRHRSHNQLPPTTEPPVSPRNRSALVNQRAADLSTALAASTQNEAATLARQQAAADQNDGAILWDAHELLVKHRNKEVTIQGRLLDFRKSTGNKTLYLLFAPPSERNAACGAITIKDAPDDLSEKSLAPLKGKTIRIHGTVRLQTISGLQRPDIKIEKRSSINPLD